jgi:hypothetical protein
LRACWRRATLPLTRTRGGTQAVAKKFSSAVPLASLAGKPPEDVWCAQRTHTRTHTPLPPLPLTHTTY